MNARCSVSREEAAAALPGAHRSPRLHRSDSLSDGDSLSFPSAFTAEAGQGRGSPRGCSLCSDAFGWEKRKNFLSRFQTPPAEERQALPEQSFWVCPLSEQRPSPVSPRLANSGHSKARRAGEASRAWEKQTWVCTVLSRVPPAEFLSGKWMNEQTRKFGFVVSKESHDNTKAFLVRFVD